MTSAPNKIRFEKIFLTNENFAKLKAVDVLSDLIVPSRMLVEKSSRFDATLMGKLVLKSESNNLDANFEAAKTFGGGGRRYKIPSEKVGTICTGASV